MKIECVDCKTEEDHLYGARPIVEFIEKHPQHKTWMTNHFFDKK